MLSVALLSRSTINLAALEAEFGDPSLTRAHGIMGLIQLNLIVPMGINSRAQTVDQDPGDHVSDLQGWCEGNLLYGADAYSQENDAPAE